ncbi:serine hydrolase domain-containing protein [Salipiger mangrovisoli]|uniref:Beta-lactamase family protein n=1 Tax=Salipiger mangrovisoli TaxID=2865933 RepID=A0ABR9X306_9RHOB|nr:serine hydrolase domain-containing protein [Salipiger mangrovisoli]MBE9637969.1 beta-lactamase family protein [Salipiger mangrovisoli]
MFDADWAAAQAAAEEELERWDEQGPGAVVLGIERGRLQLLAARGRAECGGAALDGTSVFRWASVTKHVLAACLLESGVLPLEMPLGAALPELAPAPAAVTVAQALAMQGGLPDTRESLTLLGFHALDRTDAAALLAWSAGIDRLNAEPGTEVAYSNGGYRLLEAALARRGVVFAEWVAARAGRLGLGMHASEHWSDPVPGLVPGHVVGQTGWSHGAQGMHLSAAGSLSGSAEDLALWLADLMPRPEFARMSRPLPLASGQATSYGLGLRLLQIGGEMVAGHGGAQPGYRAGFLCAPGEARALVVLSNRDDGDATGIAARVWARMRSTRLRRDAVGTWAPPGLYAAPGGDLWAEVKPGAISVRDAEEALFAASDGWVESAAPQSMMRLRCTDGAIVGEMFHKPVRLLPVSAGNGEAEAPELDGHWIGDGALLGIRGTRLRWGAGPRATDVALTPLGNGRWLFPAMGRRICLTRLAPDRVRLSLARSRVVEYRRL